jgi:hypothetical protein
VEAALALDPATAAWNWMCAERGFVSSRRLRVEVDEVRRVVEEVEGVADLSRTDSACRDELLPAQPDTSATHSGNNPQLAGQP